MENKNEPTVVRSNRALKANNFRTLLNERIKFESKVEILVNEFCDFIDKQGYDKKRVLYYKNALGLFNRFISAFDIKDLTQVTRAMASSSFIRFMNKGVYVYYSFDKTKQRYRTDFSIKIKEFFMFLHTHKNISNTKVLKALCSKQELKGLQIK